MDSSLLFVNIQDKDIKMFSSDNGKAGMNIHFSPKILFRPIGHSVWPLSMIMQYCKSS